MMSIMSYHRKGHRNLRISVCCPDEDLSVVDQGWVTIRKDTVTYPYLHASS